MTLSFEERTQFNSLMRKSYKKVYNLAYRLAGNKSDAEDLTQEAFFRAFRGYGSYEGDKPFENWIFRIVTRLFLDLSRARKRRVRTVSFDAPIRPDGTEDTVLFETADEKLNPEESLFQTVVSEEMEMSLAELTEDQRRLIWLADVQGLPYSEIAAMFKAPVGTIRSRLHRAHRQLRECLTRPRSNRGLCTS